MEKKLSLTVALAVSAFVLAAEPVTLTGDAVVPSSDGAMELVPGKRVWTQEMVPVDPAKSYILSGEFRTVKEPGTNSPAVFLGVISYDAKKRHIARSMVDAIEGTETELVAPAAKGDKTLIVKDASKWIKTPSAFAIAFDVQPEYADLPNRKLAMLITKIEQVENGWKVDFSIPLKADYPAGTPVRQHREGSYCWCGLNNKVISGEEWTAAGSSVTGEYSVGAGYKKFWKGTRFVKIVLFCSKGSKLEFRNLDFSEEN